MSSRGLAGLGALAARTGVPQEQAHSTAHSQKAADEEVAADGAPDQERRVHAQGFDEEAPDGVEAHVEQHYIPVPEAICDAAGDPEQRQADEQVPDRLVEEGRVKGLDVGELGGSVLGCYPYGPRQVGGPSEELLVEVIAPAAYGLGEDEARRGRVGEDERAYATIPAEEKHTQETTRHRTVDPQTPVPDLENAGDRVARVEVVVGDDVVDASPDEAQRDDEEQRVEGERAVVAPAVELAPCQPGGGDYPQRDEQPVVAQGERPHLEDDRRRRARQRQEHGGWSQTTAPGGRPRSGRSPSVAGLRATVRRRNRLRGCAVPPDPRSSRYPSGKHRRPRSSPRPPGAAPGSRSSRRTSSRTDRPSSRRCRSCL